MKRERARSPLRLHRKRADLTQQELAHELKVKLGVSYTKSAISKWETGKNRPSAEVLEAIEDICGLREGHLLGAYGYRDEAATRPILMKRLSASKFRAGAMTLPLVRIVGGDGKTRYTYPNGIRTVFHDTRYEAPADIRDDYNQLLKLRKEEADRAVFEQRNMIRLDDYQISLSDPYGEPRPLTLHVSLTDYYEMMVTNRSMNARLPSDKVVIRDVYGGDPCDFACSKLANPLAVNLSLVTTQDWKIYYARRGQKVATNPGGLGPAASGTAILADFDESRNYNPFLTAQRKAVEEITGQYRPTFEEITFFGLGRALTWYFPFLFGELRLNMSEDDLRTLIPKNIWDKSKLIALPFETKEVISHMKQIYRYMKESDDPLPGTTIFSLCQSLIYQYPDQWEEIKEMMRKV